MLIIFYLLDIASDVTSKKNTPLCPLSRGELDLWYKIKERISPGLTRGLIYIF